MVQKKIAKPAQAPPYPRHSLEKALRIPKGILEQNAGKECSDEESATYIGNYGDTLPFTLI